MSTTFDPRLTAYFGEAVLGAGFLPTPHLFLRHYVDLGLDSVLAMFVLQLMETTWDLGEPPRTSRDFAQRMGVGTKAIQRYTSRIEALGLVNVSAQFDASGAQVENRYDLSPLFKRLAALVADRPCHHERRRQSHHASQSAPIRYPSEDTGLRVNALAHPSSDLHHAGRHLRRSPSAETIHAAPDQVIQGPGIARSGLKETLRINNKQQDHTMHDALRQLGIADQGRHDVVPTPTWSLRQQRVLEVDEVAASQTLLTRMAIDNPVRTRIAEGVAPEDIWALRVYSAAKGWSPALTVSQVYDKHQKQVQVAPDLEQIHYKLGARLCALDLEAAEATLDLVMQWCPGEPQRLAHAPLLQSAAPSLLSVIESLWRVVAQLRGYPQAPLPLSTGSDEPVPPQDQEQRGDDTQIWQVALHELQTRIPATEFLTWLEPSVLLDRDDQPDCVHVVIGVPNIFARDTVIQMYLSLIEEILTAVLQKPTTVQIELATPKAVPRTCNIPIPVEFTRRMGDRQQMMRQVS